MDYKAEIKKICDNLGLKVLHNYEEQISQECNFEENLYSLLFYEQAEREQRNISRRTHDAGFPTVKTLDTYDFNRMKYLKKSDVEELAKCDFITNKGNCAMIGDSGTGKSHLAISLGVEAIKRKHSVKFFRGPELATMLKEAESQNALTAMLKKIDKISLLIVDELGYMDIDKSGVNNLFSVFAARYETRSTIVTSNYQFSEWEKFLGNPILAKALIDKLAHQTTFLDMRGPSYRLSEAQKRVGKKENKG